MLDFGPGSFFLTPSQLSDSPSSRHGIPSYTEKALRLYACEIIQEAGILLRLPQAVAATAQVLLHRFFCKQSFRDFDARSAAASCFWLSMKLEEEEGASNRGRKPSQLDDVVAMFENIRARREGDLPLLQHSVAFKRRKEELLKLETRILVELGFVCHVEHPHKILLGYLNSLGSSRELVQEAWNMVNDSLRTTLCVSFSSNVIACGVIYAAARRLSVSLPENPPWWLLFDVTFDEILEICHTLADLYRQPKSQYIDVSQLCKTLVVPPSSEASSVNTAEPALPPLSESLPVTTEPIPVVVEPGDATDCRKDVSVVSLSSASKVLNSCLVNASGLPLSKGVFVGGIVVAHQLQQVQPDRSKKGTSRDVTSEVENKDVKVHLSSQRRSHECPTSKRDYRDMEGSYKHSYREPEHKHRRRGDYSSFHESKDRCSSSHLLMYKQENGLLCRVEACCHNSYSSLLVKCLLGDLSLKKGPVYKLQEKWACCHGSAYCAGTLEGKLLGKMQPGYRIACNWSLCWDSMASLKSYTYPYLISAMLNHATWP